MICPACAAENDDAADTCFQCGKGLNVLTQGAVLASRYEILSPLGRGGMGIVYKARDRELDETVALKILRSGNVSSPEMRRRFRSEIKLARKVRHRNVCGIHEYGQDGHFQFIAMELIDGVDLKVALRQRKALPPEEAFSVAIQLAEGLEAIHEVGIVHRDLKTSNVMLDSKGCVRLMDFGIAKRVESEGTSGATAAGHIVGTPEYMSPEQARGDKIDQRSDVYALGVVVFELFTGSVPFRGDSPIATIMKQIEAPPPLEGPEAASLPQAVVPILRKALAKTPAERYGSALEMADALRDARAQALSGSIPALQVSAPARELLTPIAQAPASIEPVATAPPLRVPPTPPTPLTPPSQTSQEPGPPAALASFPREPVSVGPSEALAPTDQVSAPMEHLATFGSLPVGTTSPPPTAPPLGSKEPGQLAAPVSVLREPSTLAPDETTAPTDQVPAPIEHLPTATPLPVGATPPSPLAATPLTSKEPGQSTRLGSAPREPRLPEPERPITPPALAPVVTKPVPVPAPLPVGATPPPLPSPPLSTERTPRERASVRVIGPSPPDVREQPAVVRRPTTDTYPAAGGRLRRRPWLVGAVIAATVAVGSAAVLLQVWRSLRATGSVETSAPGDTTSPGRPASDGDSPSPPHPTPSLAGLSPEPTPERISGPLPAAKAATLSSAVSGGSGTHVGRARESGAVGSTPSASASPQPARRIPDERPLPLGGQASPVSTSTPAAPHDEPPVPTSLPAEGPGTSGPPSSAAPPPVTASPTQPAHVDPVAPGASPAAAEGRVPLSSEATKRETEPSGTLVLRVKPAATIEVDGSSIGQLSGRVLVLSPGAYTISFNHPDFEPLRRVVTIRSGQRSELAVDLKDEAVRRKR